MGQSTTITGSFLDPGILDAHSISIDWGDGSAATTLHRNPGDLSYSAGHTYLSASPVDGFIVTVSVTDDADTGVGVGRVVVLANSLAVTASVDPAAIDEGSSTTLRGRISPALATDSHTVTIRWGDGVAPTTLQLAAGVVEFSASHLYRDDAPTATSSDNMPISISVVNARGGSGTAGATVLVRNVAPVIGSLASGAEDCCDAACGPVQLAAAFSEVGTLDTHRAVISWGDGTQTTLAESDSRINQAANKLAASHTYGSGGIYSITLTLFDDDGGSVSRTTTAYVVGVGLNNGVLQIVGTEGRDFVFVHRAGSLLRVDARLDARRERDDNDHDWCDSRGRRNDCDDDRNRNRDNDCGDDNDDDDDEYRGDCNRHANDRYYRHFEFNLSRVTSIVIIGCDGDDHLQVDEPITISASIDGGEGDDYLRGGSGQDLLVDLDGANRIYGGNGNDTVTAGGGDDFIHTGDGDDIVQAGPGDNMVHAGRGNNRVTAGNGCDQIFTLDGNDLIDAGHGDNEVHAGEGNDTVTTGHGNDRVWTDGGNDVIFVGNGCNDVWAGAGNDTVNSGSGNDNLDAGTGDDLVRAGDGNDCVTGGSGNDVLLGGKGNDQLSGGDGRDILIGGFGSDRLIGNGDDDLLIAGWTSFDDNDAALTALLKEWSSGNNYNARMTNLAAGTGQAGGNRLIGNDGVTQTVFNDNDVDTLSGSQAQDWFFANQVADNGGVLDLLTDKATSETWLDTDF